MTDQEDDALTWAGDDDLEAGPVARSRTRGTAVAEPDEDAPPGGRLTPVLVMLGVAAVVETALWVQSVFTGAIGQALGYPGDQLAEQVAWVLVLVVRIGAVLSPLVWMLVVLRVQPDERRRAALVAVGVVLLLPWPAILRLVS